MTPGQIAFVVLVTVTAVAISAVLFMQQWVNGRLQDHDKATDDRLASLEKWRKASEDQDTEEEENPYTWLTKATHYYIKHHDRASK